MNVILHDHTVNLDATIRVLVSGAQHRADNAEEASQMDSELSIFGRGFCTKPRDMINHDNLVNSTLL